MTVNDDAEPRETIRAATPSDAGAIAALANALGRDLGGEGTSMTADIVTEAFLEGRYGLDVLVADRGDGPVGYALHRIDFETSFGVRGRYMSDLYVAPAARGRGLGRALIAHVAEIADAEGGCYVWWVTTRSEGSARRLYERLADVDAPVTSFAVTRERFRAFVGEAADWRRGRRAGGE